MTRKCLSNGASAPDANPDGECPPNFQAPTLPQANKDGVLDLSLLDAEGSDIVVRVMHWENYASGDSIIAYFNKIASSPRIIERYEHPPFDVLIKTSDIPNGQYLVKYELHKAPPIYNCSQSKELPITVIGSKNLFCSPVFPDARDGVLYYQTIQDKQGTPIRSNYPNIVKGDQIVFYWHGYDAEGNTVAAATYTSTSYTATLADQDRGYVESTIPAEKLLAVGDGGGGKASYTVTTRDGAIKQSPDTQVGIRWDDTQQLQITSTTLAAAVSDGLPLIKPYNHVTVSGTPGISITASVFPGGAIAEARGDSVYQTQLDYNGQARFRVFSTTTSHVTVEVSSSPMIGATPTAEMDFFSYQSGSAGILAYRYTTNAPSDDTTPCSIYLVVNPELTTQKVHVEVTGHALINHVLTTIDIPPNPDGSATVNIYNKQTENVTATLYVLGQSEPPVQLTMAFIRFPEALPIHRGIQESP